MFITIYPLIRTHEFLIKECMRELDEENRQSIYKGLEEAYKNMWIKKQSTETGFKCGA